MSIDWTKPIELVCDDSIVCKARAIPGDAGLLRGSDCRIVVIEQDSDHEYVAAVRPDGSLDNACSWPNVRNVRERFERQVWVNVYPHNSGHGIHSTREDAEFAATDTRIACIRVTISGYVGEGLEDKP